MGFFAKLDKELQKDLISFVEEQKAKPRKTLGEAVIEQILRDIISGDCKITGSVTDHKEKKMFIEFTFFEEKNES